MPSSKISATNYEVCVQQAVDFVRRYSAASEVLIVAPTTEAANEVVRRACESSLLGVHAITLRNLARVLAEDRLHSMGLQEITAVAREAVVAKIAAETKLSYFHPVSRTPGFPKALSRTIRELRMEDAKPDGELGTLLAAYTCELQERSLADVAAVFTAAIRTVRDRSHRFCGLPIVLLDVPADHALERQLLDQLTASASEALELGLGPDFKPPGVLLFSASSEALECVEIARRAGELAAEGTPFDQMAVLARDAVRLQPLLEEAFDRAGIPIWFAGGCVRPSASGRAFLALLHCANERLAATRFLEYLSLGQARGLRSPRWERMILNARVTGGIDRWQRRLDRLSWDGDAEFSKRAEALARFALPILESLAALPTSAPWAEWLDRLASLADRAIYDRRPLLDYLEQLQPLSEIGSHSVGLGEIINLLGDHLRNLREKPDALRYGRVFAASIEDARGMAFDVVFVPGLCEGSFPEAASRRSAAVKQGSQASLECGSPMNPWSGGFCTNPQRVRAIGLLFRTHESTSAPARARVPSLYAYDVLQRAR